MDGQRKIRLSSEYGSEVNSSVSHSRIAGDCRSYDSVHQSQNTVTSMDRSSINDSTSIPMAQPTVNIQRSLLFTDDIIRRERGANSLINRSQSASRISSINNHSIRGIINPAFEHSSISPSPVLPSISSRNLSNVSISTLSSTKCDQTAMPAFTTSSSPRLHASTNNYDFAQSSSDLSSNMSILGGQQCEGNRYLRHLKQFFTPDFDEDHDHDQHRNPSSNGGCCSIFWRLMTNLIPILGWLPKYDFRHDALSDLLTGCTIVALHIPQGLAYSQLAGLAPVNGLYVSLFPVVIYAILGGSRQLSVGTFAVVCITCKDVLTSLSHDINIVDFELHNFNLTSRLNGTSTEDYTSVEVLTSLALMVGAILLVMGVLRLGVLATLLSEPIISAFVVASSLYVLTSQIFDLIGIKSRYGDRVIPFELLDNWYQFCAHLDMANLYTIGLSTLTVVCLLTSKNFIEPYIQKRFNLKNFALPAELLAIIVVTSLSSIFKFHDHFNIVVIPKLDAGFGHMPVMPRVSLWSNGALITGAFVIAFIVYATSFTLAKLFADNHNYRVNANQELLALGSANIVGSFFLCFPASGSLARSAVQEKVGGKTQLASLYSAAFLVLFLLFLSGYLATLPKGSLMHLSVEHFRRQFRTKILQPLRKQKTSNVKFVIFDSHAVSYIDGKGVEILCETRETLRQIGNIELLLAGCNRSVHDTLEKCGYFKQNKQNQENRLLFATVIDAVYWAKMHHPPRNLLNARYICPKNSVQSVQRAQDN